MTNPLPIIRPETAILLVVDVQDRLLPAIHDADACVRACGRMIDAARVLAVPALVSEQYPEGLGRTCEPLARRLPDAPVVTKTRFSACVEGIVTILRENDRPHVIVVGIEAHVCVLQTVLDLLRLGYTPYVCADAVGSRRPLDRDTAIQRVARSGAILTTTESVTLEMLGEAATETFKKILRIIK